MAAALRVAVAAANHGHLTTLCPFLLRPLSNTITNKALNHNRNLKGLSRKSFTCRAVYNPEEVQIKEEGQSESPEYRVFLVDRSGKKVSPWHDIPLRLGNGIFNFVVEIPKDTRAKMEVATDEPYTTIIAALVDVDLKATNMLYVYALTRISDCSTRPWGTTGALGRGERGRGSGTLTAIRDWFRDYKIPDGKPANRFGLGNQAANKEYALKVINETNESWAKLIKRFTPAKGLSLF
ncbi:Soluble inorganic pyrophosphatase 1, chloroplastic [Morella rubra]|uniref:inorganic diphosphatase n=1 Tax=Morella rubra TaxID=262757 RepID=A0A6A1VJY6_9ROSI|nr:Soluble inorganic pyrophosphatase 1, chloroplastic [Morella rubra]